MERGDQAGYRESRPQEDYDITWGIETEYELGEDLHEDQDMEFESVLQQISVLTPPIKIMLYNLPYKASHQDISKFCLPDDPTQIKEIQKYSFKGKPTGEGHIILKTRQAAKDVMHNWGYSLMGRNIDMDLAYEDEEWQEEGEEDLTKEAQPVSNPPKYEPPPRQQYKTQAYARQNPTPAYTQTAPKQQSTWRQNVPESKPAQEKPSAWRQNVPESKPAQEKPSAWKQNVPESIPAQEKSSEKNQIPQETTSAPDNKPARNQTDQAPKPSITSQEPKKEPPITAAPAVIQKQDAQPAKEVEVQPNILEGVSGTDTKKEAKTGDWDQRTTEMQQKNNPSDVEKQIEAWAEHDKQLQQSSHTQTQKVERVNARVQPNVPVHAADPQKLVEKDIKQPTNDEASNKQPVKSAWGQKKGWGEENYEQLKNIFAQPKIPQYKSFQTKPVQSKQAPQAGGSTVYVKKEESNREGTKEQRQGSRNGNQQRGANYERRGRRGRNFRGGNQGNYQVKNVPAKESATIAGM